LARCLRYAEDNNLQIKQAAISIRQAELTQDQNKKSRFSGLLYGGGQIQNSIKQSQHDVAAAQADADVVKNNLGLSVAQAYLQVLLTQDQIGITQNRLKQTQDRLERSQKLVDAGAAARVTLLDLEAQVASDEQSIVASENAVVQAYAVLKTQLNLDPDYKMTIARPAFVHRWLILEEYLPITPIWVFAQRVKSIRLK